MFSLVQSLSCVRLFETPWTAAHQASLSITNTQSPLKLMSFESVMPSNHLILCCPLLFLLQTFPSPGSFLMSQFFISGETLLISIDTRLKSRIHLGIRRYFGTIQAKETFSIIRKKDIYKGNTQSFIAFHLGNNKQTAVVAWY